MKRVLLILAVAGITDLPGCYVCTAQKIGSVVNFAAVTWPAGIALPPELQPYANAQCTERGWIVPTVDVVAPFDFSKLPPPVQVNPIDPPTIIFPIGKQTDYVFPTNVPPKPAAP